MTRSKISNTIHNLEKGFVFLLSSLMKKRSLNLLNSRCKQENNVKNTDCAPVAAPHKNTRERLGWMSLVILISMNNDALLKNIGEEIEIPIIGNAVAKSTEVNTQRSNQSFYEDYGVPIRIISVPVIDGKPGAVDIIYAPLINEDYTVKDGDTLYGIASSHNTTLCKLLDVNYQIEDPNNIREGLVLNIPDPNADDTEKCIDKDLK